MSPSNTLLHRVCQSCRISYSTEVPDLLKGGEAWPTRCPVCGRLKLTRIEPRSISIRQ
jgi:predicted  nucleic acid-binding Zn-ribbon protein